MSFHLCRRPPTALLVVLCACTAAACGEPRIRRTAPRPPAPAQMAELWVEPSNIAARDLFWGPGGRALAPRNGATFTFKEEKAGGFSPGLTVEDAQGREWSAKQGPEAQTEVVASRIYWAAGYRQPPTYFLAHWSVEGGPSSGAQNSARFRPEIGKVIGEWSLHRNPFVGTQPYRGLLALAVILNNWDIKPSQNKIYEFGEPRDGARRWYVARDLGATFGRPRWPDGSRNNPDHFEAHPFIIAFDGDRPRFGDQGRHDELLNQLRRRDIRWISERLARITDRQFADAFRAAGYPDAIAGRFIARLQEKIADGLAACPRGC
ncbi:MAG: hypothetical protein HYU53_11915 [Acidobacteria bacterium]|nr:hypothetical protein [Acidobacteriota bacterium]